MTILVILAIVMYIIAILCKISFNATSDFLFKWLYLGSNVIGHTLCLGYAIAWHRKSKKNKNKTGDGSLS